MDVKRKNLRELAGIRARIARHMIPVKEIAGAMGVTTTYVSAVLRGRKYASRQTIRRIKEAISGAITLRA